MTIDISKIKPGDKVTLVPLEVCATDDAFDLIYVIDHEGGACFRADQIAAHHPAPREFQVGDDVRNAAQLRGTILALAEGYAMVRWPQGNVTVKPCYSLTLVGGGE